MPPTLDVRQVGGLEAVLEALPSAAGSGARPAPRPASRLWATIWILTRSDVSGEDVVRGPLSRMFLVMFHVVAIFAIGIFDSPVGRG